MRLSKQGWEGVVSRSWRPANWWNSWWIIPGSKWLSKGNLGRLAGEQPQSGDKQKTMITNHFLVAALTWEFWKFPRAMCHWGWPNRTSKKYRTKHRKSSIFQQRQHFDDVNIMARCLILYGLIKQHVLHSVLPSYFYSFDHSKIYINILPISA